jgi:hypothetical protein
MKTNIGLVEHAKMALQEKWGYVWGTFGQALTETVLKQKAKQYPNEVGVQEIFIRDNWLNRRTADCVGLIKSYLWWKDGYPVYDAKTDISANGMYAAATEKGPISTMPEIPGVCLWKDGHIGVYIGNGQVIEAHGTKYGVIQTPLKGPGSTPWTHWLKCPFIEYVEELNWKQILQKVADDPGGWEIAINSLVLASESGMMNSIYKHLPLLLEKIYNK